MRWMAVVMLGGVLVGCASTGGTKSSKPAAPEYLTLSVEKPLVELAAGYSFTQEVDGVSITFTPVEYKELTLTKRALQEKKSLLTLNDMHTYTVTETPVVFYGPAELGFTLSVANHLDHVLRFKDCVFTLTVDGKPQSTQEAEELLGTVLVPEQSWEGSLTGPDRATIAPGANIVFSIYDVPTAVDAANNPTKKTNFEWVFTYKTEKVEKQAEIKHYEKKMTREQAAEFARGIGG